MSNGKFGAGVYRAPSMEMNIKMEQRLVMTPQLRTHPITKKEIARKNRCPKGTEFDFSAEDAAGEDRKNKK